MAPPPATAPPSPELTAGCWKARLIASGASSLAARRWPVQLVLTNTDEQAHHFGLQSVVQIRLRSARLGLSLLCEEHAPPGDQHLRVEPGGELRLPLNLLERVAQVARLAPGPYKVTIRLRSDEGPLVLPPTVLQLDP